jgi:succinate dehydrogenase / fumarate reductase, cytochrome b subunit
MLYKGKEGQWAFFLHRFSGLAILFYLLLHVFSISSLAISKELYSSIHELYKQPVFGIGLVFVAAGVMYHALNGLRIICMDLFGWGVRFQRELWYVTMFVSALTSILILVVVVKHMLEGV